MTDDFESKKVEILNEDETRNGSNRYGNKSKSPISGMFREWYLEYASYVILERAVPHIEDGLKPVQRRILHAMQTTDNGRYNKVAGIVGETMKYHPHGDASISDALVQLGQKELLIDTQGNWGNIITGDSAAAARYIEARLSEFALETVFCPKITEWVPSYDGARKEPVTLPIKFPLLLAQGVEGIAVGLSSKILPHNFNEIIDAAVSYLQEDEFSLYPDFQTGGFLDASRYNDGARGGNVKVRAKIEKIDNKTLAITELPFGKTTGTLITSILSAVEKGKIKIKKVDDITSANANIIIHLIPGTSSDKAIDALYAFTDCEVSISPNCCVIQDKKPRFLTVSDLLKYSVDYTQELLRLELDLKLKETMEAQLFCSLEKIFIEERIYKDSNVEQAPDMDSAIARVDYLLEPFKRMFFREITRDDLIKLWEIRMGRILKFNSAKADEKIAALDEEIARLRHDLEHIVEFTVKWYQHLKEKYGANFPRRTVLRGFDSIEASKVVEANKRLYFDKEGFVGTSLKDSKFLFTCSDLDDLIIIYRDGMYKTVRVSEKQYIGKKVLHIGVFKKGDERTVYNLIYRHGKTGPYYKKRCFITGLTREKEYYLTKKDEKGSRIEYLSANPNGEAEVVKVSLSGVPIPNGRRPRNQDVIVNFADLAIKGKEALGNLVTKYQIENVVMIEKGHSTLGGRNVWFDSDVLRLNYDGRGKDLGVFQGDDRILVVTNDGQFYTTSYSEGNHYEDNILLIEKFDPSKVWTLIFKDPELGNYPYLKRFSFEDSPRPQRFVGSDNKSTLLNLTDKFYSRFEVIFGGADSVRPPLEIDSDEFVGIKSFRAKGKRLTTYQVDKIEELEPLREPEIEEPKSADLQEEKELSETRPVHIDAVQGDLFSEELVNNPAE